MRHQGISEAALHYLAELFYAHVRADPLIGLFRPSELSRASRR